MKNRQNYGRNYWALTFEGVSFVAAINLMATGGAVALFINTMTGSVTLAGLAITAQSFFLLLGQLIIAPYIGAIRNLPGAMFKIMSLRLIPFLMAIPLFLGVGGHLAVGIFLVLLSLFWLSDGLNTVPWGELTARALKPEVRGHMMGMQVAIAGAVSLLTGLLLQWLLATPALSDYHRFGTIFALTGAILMPSLIFIRLVKDPSPIETPIKPDLRGYYAKLLPIIKNSKPLRYAIIARIPGFIGFSTLTFLILFGKNELGITEDQASWLVYSQIAGGLLGGVLLGEISRRLGNKAVIVICNIGTLITLSLAIIITFIPSLGYLWLLAICVFASIWASHWLGYFNYFLDIAPREDRPAFQVIGNCIGIPFSFVGYAIGAVIDQWGFLVAFAIASITAIITIILSLRLLSRKEIKALELVQ
ncbi:MAG: MFS transporter [Oscillospiraceae bacterium]|nr:MFS transporter [Oscillospiraceae bacterium]